MVALYVHIVPNQWPYTMQQTTLVALYCTNGHPEPLMGTWISSPAAARPGLPIDGKAVAVEVVLAYNSSNSALPLMAIVALVQPLMARVAAAAFVNRMICRHSNSPIHDGFTLPLHIAHLLTMRI